MLRIVTVFLSLLCLTAVAADEQVVIFGDSLSDEGLIYALTDDQYPPAPFYQGRFSNGPVWTEYAFTSHKNYSYGGAQSNRDNVLTTKLGDVVAGTGLFGQIDQYIANEALSKNIQNTLFIIYIGGNDLFAMMDPASPDSSLTLKRTVENIKVSADRLKQAGAKNITIMGLPNLAATPWVQTLPRPQQRALSRLTSHFNRSLHLMAHVNQLQYFDSNAVMTDILDDPTLYGFSNVEDACLDIVNETICDNPEEYLFWDSLHPTTHAHQLFAEAFQGIEE